MELGEPDASGRRRPIAKPGSRFLLDVETVIIAIGNIPNPLLKNTTPGLETQKWGGIVVEAETMATSLEGVYAGGDAVTGAATVIQAMGAGRKPPKPLMTTSTAAGRIRKIPPASWAAKSLKCSSADRRLFL